MGPLKLYPVPGSLGAFLALLNQEPLGLIESSKYQIFWFRATEDFVSIHTVFRGTTIISYENSFFVSLNTGAAFSFVAQPDGNPIFSQSTELFEAFVGGLTEGT